jgi:lipopolysaccharide transport system permease protein
MHKAEIIIEPRKQARHVWRELWLYRELLFFMAWRDLIVRYKQTVIGIAWSVLRPVITMVILTLVFGKLAKLPSGEVPYPLLVYSAMLPWQFFSNTFSTSANSLVSNSNMISKTYFPRIILPTTAMLTSLVDFLIAFSIYILMMFWYGVYPDWRIVVLPLLMILASLASLGAGFFVSALNVTYRDFRIVVPFIVQFGLYLSPVGFSSDVVPEQWRLLYSLNPMVGVIDGFRWALLGGEVKLYMPGFILSTCLSLLIFLLGIRFFYRSERTFADII